MTSTVETVVTTAAQTAAALAATDPKAAALLLLAPVAVQLLENITAMQAAGTMSMEEIQASFAKISANVQSTHDAWVAMNK